MKFDVDDTIAAIASAPGSSLRGIVRICGPDALNLIADGFPLVAADPSISIREWLANPGRASLLACRIELQTECWIEADLLVWPDNRSFTGQPAVEIHAIGSPIVLQLVLECLLDCGCRLAEPGEFTLRAFLSNRIDLTQAEAVLELIDARDRKQFNLALKKLAGGIGGPIGEIRDRLLALLAELEAGLDFVEDDIEFISAQSLHSQLDKIANSLKSLTRQILSRHVAAETVTAVLIGRPNVGKSSLFNQLTGSQAIVSPERGTTRDYLTAELRIDGLRIELVDTAGIESGPIGCEASGEGVDSVDSRIGQQTGSWIECADIPVLCLESGGVLNGFERSLIDSKNANLILAMTKVDLMADVNQSLTGAIAVSSKTGLGIPRLRARIAEVARAIHGAPSSTAANISRASSALASASASVDLARDAAGGQWGEEIVAAELRMALDHLGRVVGAIYTDDLLDQIFSRFCIGK